MSEQTGLRTEDQEQLQLERGDAPDTGMPRPGRDPAEAAAQPYLLEMIDIDKQFPGVKALDHARLQLRAGTVHALMGENGAGKSTLI